MTTLAPPAPPLFLGSRYAPCIETSRRVRWDLERDLLRGRSLDFGCHFLPADLTRVAELGFLDAAQARSLAQRQGLSYARLFAAIEQVVAVRTLELGHRHRHADPLAMQALVRVTEDELKHEALFRRVAGMAAAGAAAPEGDDADAGGWTALMYRASDWAALALSLQIGLATQAHYRASIGEGGALCPLWRDLLLLHWQEESHHAVVDELEWRREHALLDAAGRERALGEYIEALHALERLLVAQAEADAAAFARQQRLYAMQHRAVLTLLARAYRWQHIVCGLQEPRFAALRRELLDSAQQRRLARSLAPIVAAATATH